MVVLRAQIDERTPEGVLVGQGPSEFGSEMDHFLPGGVCEEVTEWLAIVGCAKVFRGNLAVAPAG
jgi:hypothetical protein